MKMTTMMMTTTVVVVMMMMTMMGERVEAKCKTAERQREWLDAVSVLHTYTHKGATIHCVDYLDQPGLWNAGKQEREEARKVAAYLAAESKPNNGNNGCPAGSVAVTGVREDVCVPSKRSPLPEHHLSSSEHDVSGPEVNYTDYSYVVSPQVSVEGASEVYGVFSVGIETKMPTCLANDACHSLNQLWWLHHTPSQFFSLEAGWIKCNYFTPEVTTALFTYSTNDGYRGDKQDEYNMLGGFVVAPQADVVPGKPLDSVSFQLAYKAVDDISAFVLYSSSFELSQNASGVVCSGKTNWVPVGHYPYSRYPGGKPDFNRNQCGAEMYHTTTTITASGRIYGWGSDLKNEPINNAFGPIPANTGFLHAYGSALWSPHNPYASPTSKYVQFSGQPSHP